MLNYTKLDKKIDDYLGTTNLRPGPPKRLVNNKILKKETNETKEKKVEINYSAESMKVTKNIKWAELIGVKKSDAGADGVFFLEFLNKKLLVLKACVDLPCVYFGSLFCKCMQLDTPDCRIIEYQDPEFHEMIMHLEKVALSDIRVYNKIEYDLKERPFLLIYEYVPSLMLYDFGISRANQIFKPENFKSREIFLSLGKILAVDVFFNNYDRIPWVWNNPGNPNNILFRVNMDLLPPNCNFKDPKFLDIFIENTVAIDTKPICLDPHDKVALRSLGNYLNTISEQFKEFFYEMKNLMIYGKNIESFEFKCFSKLVEFFQNSCGIIITSFNIFHISLGFIIMLDDITATDIESIQKLIDFVQKKAILHDWADVFKSNAKLLNINYFKYIMNFYKQLKEENQEIFKWVKDVTQDFYSVKFDQGVDGIINSQAKFVFSFEPPKKENVGNQNNNPVLAKQEESVDDFNANKNDAKKFSNDVHNGIYDVFEIDPSLIMEVKKFEFNQPIEAEVPIPDIKIEPPIKKKLDIKKIEEDLDPHQTYTREELKDKIKKDELKQTLFMKKKYNPNEAKFLEEKIKNVDESFFQEDEEEKRNSKK